MRYVEELLLKHVMLETGFNEVNGTIISTATEKYDVLIEDGVIKAIDKELKSSGIDIVDGEGHLLLPAMREMHIHIDKTYFGGPWQAPRAITNGIFTRFEEEETLLPRQLETAEERAHAVVSHYISQGHRHIRSHCNVDPQIGTKHIELTKRVLDTYAGILTYDIVAFPQHGLLRSQVYGLMDQAMTLGATHVGGVDPSTVDRDVDRSLYQLFDLATKHDAGLDIHLHNRDSLGEYEFYKLADYTEKSNKAGLVTISHGMALGDLQGESLDKMVTRLKELDIDVTTTVPINRPTMPVPYLAEQGLKVSLGHDSLTDHWSPFGTGSTIEKMNTLAERFGISSEFGLSRLLGFATDNVTPLTSKGDISWPQVGDRADFMLVDAVSSAHAIARKRIISKTILNGRWVYDNQERIEVGE